MGLAHPTGTPQMQPTSYTTSTAPPAALQALPLVNGSDAQQG